MVAERIVVVDDEPSLIKLVSLNLRARGYQVVDAANGIDGIERVKQYQPDLVLLDLGMPGLDGFEVCTYIREMSEVPIIMLTARDTEGDKIRALDLGADDYLTKPFGIGEMMARVRATLRRASRMQAAPTRQDALRAGDLTVDFAHRRVTFAGNEIRLTPIEYMLLEHFAIHSDQVITHRELLTSVWGAEYCEEVGYLRVYIGRLRRKLELEPSNPKRLVTEPGVGYRFKPIP